MVEPKRQKLREAEQTLEGANKQLAEKQAALAAVVGRVNVLRQALADAEHEQRQLHEQVRSWKLGMQADGGCRLWQLL